MGVGRIASDEESLVLLKPVVQFSFTCDGVSRAFLYKYEDCCGCLIVGKYSFPVHYNKTKDSIFSFQICTILRIQYLFESKPCFLSNFNATENWDGLQLKVKKFIESRKLSFHPFQMKNVRVHSGNLHK